MQNTAAISSQCAPGRWVPLAGRRALCLALLLALPGGAQNAPPLPRLPQGMDQRGEFPDDTSNGGPMDAERRLQAQNADRQKQLVSDTNKLLKLATELNDEIGRTTADSLTPAQLRKVAEIEKLARSVKEKMSTSVRAIPVFMPPSPPIIR